MSERSARRASTMVFEPISEYKSNGKPFLQTTETGVSAEIGALESKILRKTGLRPNPPYEGQPTLAYPGTLFGASYTVYVNAAIGVSITSDMFEPNDPSLATRLKGSRELIEKIAGALGKTKPMPALRDE